MREQREDNENRSLITITLHPAIEAIAQAMTRAFDLIR